MACALAHDDGFAQVTAGDAPRHLGRMPRLAPELAQHGTHHEHRSHDAHQQGHDPQRQHDQLSAFECARRLRTHRHRELFKMPELFEQLAPHLAPGRRLLADEQLFRGLPVADLHALDDLRLQRRPAQRDLAQARRGLHAAIEIGGLVDEPGQGFIKILARLIEVVIGLGVGRVEQDVAQRLPHLQPLRIGTRHVALGRQLVVDKA